MRAYAAPSARPRLVSGSYQAPCAARIRRVRCAGHAAPPGKSPKRSVLVTPGPCATSCAGHAGILRYILRWSRRGPGATSCAGHAWRPERSTCYIACSSWHHQAPSLSFSLYLSIFFPFPVPFPVPFSLLTSLPFSFLLSP